MVRGAPGGLRGVAIRGTPDSLRDVTVRGAPGGFRGVAVRDTLYGLRGVAVRGAPGGEATQNSAWIWVYWSGSEVVQGRQG